MSRLAELIEELCPDGVEYRTLGEMGSLFGGLSGKTKSDFVEVDGACPFVTYKEVYSLLEINQIPQGRVLVSSHEKQLVLQRGDVLFTGSSENADEVGLTAVVTAGFSEPVYLNSFSICLRWYEPAFEPGYTKYLFASTSVRAQIRRCASGVTRFNLSKKRLEGVRVPVPPLEVQREIVRILDQFTTLEAELEAELEARRTQYEHYRNHLLSYDSLAACGPVDMVKLGDVVSISRGASPRPISKYVTQGEGTPWIKIGDVDPQGKFVTGTAERITSAGAKKSRRVLPGEFILSNSMSFGRPYILQIEGCVHDGWLILSDVTDHWIPDFLYHSLRTDDVQRQFVQLASGGTVRNLNSRVIESVELCLPSKVVQEQVVSVLDRFDALVNDISSGLPAEIAARRAQYEHYRDRLLSFPEKKGE